MGVIRINIGGSFKSCSICPTKEFSAMEHGHAQAVADAITFLSREILPKAVALDHSLHSEGKHPERGFSKES